MNEHIFCLLSEVFFLLSREIDVGQTGGIFYNTGPIYLPSSFLLPEHSMIGSRIVDGYFLWGLQKSDAGFRRLVPHKNIKKQLTEKNRQNERLGD